MSKASNYPVSGRGPADHDVRDQIVVAATEHFSRYGYEKDSRVRPGEGDRFFKGLHLQVLRIQAGHRRNDLLALSGEIEADVLAAVSAASSPPEKLRSLFRAIIEASLRLYSRERKLYEIATSAATERWPPVIAYEGHIQALLQDILVQGRQNGDFERKTPLDELTQAIYLVMRPYINPVLLQHSLEHAGDVPLLLSGLVLRSLSP